MTDGRGDWSALKAAFAELVDLPEVERAAAMDGIAATDSGLAARLAALLTVDTDVDSRLARFEVIAGPHPAGEPADARDQGDVLGILNTSIARFRIFELLGAGGMGIAYRAEDTRLGRAVALKFLRPGFAHDDEAKRRFLREARAASALDHPNVCTLLEVGESAVGPYLAMPAYDGETLRQRLDREGALPGDRAVDIAAQVLRGLGAAHAAGITHRDLKPANLILTSGGVVKILDFGLAEEHGTAGARAGTLSCMSPEQLTGGSVGPAADLWAVGVLLYETLTGRRPFGGGHDLATIYTILHEDPAPPASIASGIPPVLEAIVAKLLRKDPGERYDSAASVLEALQALSFPGAPAGRDSPGRAWLGAAAFLAVSVVVAATLLFRPAPFQPAPASVAVLPFADDSPTRDQAHLGDGVAEAILDALIHVPGLRVPARSSSFALAGRDLPATEIARDLDVAAVLEGTVRRDGDRLRITTRLLDGRTGSYLWSRTFDGGFGDLLDTQAEIVDAVATALRRRLAPARRPTDDMVAYELYLRGLFHWNRRTIGDLRHAIDFFTEATVRDPAFARAWSGLALSYAVLAPLDPAAEPLLPRTHEAARRALALDPTLAEPHAANGYAYHWEWRWAEAERELRRAIVLDSTYAPAYQWYGEHLAKMGRGEEGEALMRRAMALDPLSLVAQNDLGIVLMLGRRFDEAIVQFESLRRNEPGFALPALLLCRLYMFTGQAEAAASDCRVWAEMTGSADAKELETLALATSDTTLVPGAREILARWAAGPVPPWADIAVYGTLIGDRETAIDALEHAFRSHSPMLASLKVMAWFDPVRDDPRVVDLLRRMSFP